jgi:hypothetical protein
VKTGLTTINHSNILDKVGSGGSEFARKRKVCETDDNYMKYDYCRQNPKRVFKWKLKGIFPRENQVQQHLSKNATQKNEPGMK